MNAAAQAARASAWALWWASLAGMGAVFAAIHSEQWAHTAALTVAMLLLASAAGHERAEQRACEEHQLDVWLEAWA